MATNGNTPSVADMQSMFSAFMAQQSSAEVPIKATPIKATPAKTLKAKTPTPGMSMFSQVLEAAQSNRQAAPDNDRDLPGSVSADLPSGRHLAIRYRQYAAKDGQVVTSIQFDGFTRSMGGGKRVPMSFTPEQFADLYSDEAIAAAKAFMK